MLALGLGAGVALSRRLQPEHAAAGRDRPELVRLRRRRLAARLDPGRAQPRAGAALAACRRGCRRRRSRSRTAASTSTAASTTSASRAPRGRDVTAGKARPGRLDDHAAARAQSLHGQRERTFSASSRRRASRSSCRDKWSKDKILDEYLNTVYYGNHAYGVEAAAQTYFSKHASQLTLAQAALLAGLPQAPSIYDPFHDPQAALARRNEVLRAMLADERRSRQAQYRRGDSAAHAQAEAGPASTRTIKEPYFFSYVIDELEQEYGANTVREGGLKVYTTIDPRLQRLANEGDPRRAAVQDRPGRGDRLGRAGHRRDPRDDRRRAHEGRTSSTSPRSRRGRPARRSRRSCSPRRSSRASTPTRPTTPPRRSRARSGRGARQPTRGRCTPTTTPTSARRRSRAATLASDNTVYAQLTLDVGPTYVWQHGAPLGVHLAPDKPVASIGLGSLAVSPLDMAAAYATFAGDGHLREADGDHEGRPARRQGRHRRRAGAKPQTKRVVSPGVAWKVNDVLQQNARVRHRRRLRRRRPPERRQDRHDREPRRRLVRRLHAPALDRRLDGLSRRARSRCSTSTARRSRRDVPGADLARVHGGGALATAPSLDFPAAEALPALDDFTQGYFGSLGYVATTTTTTTTSRRPTTVRRRRPDRGHAARRRRRRTADDCAAAAAAAPAGRRRAGAAAAARRRRPSRSRRRRWSSPPSSSSSSSVASLSVVATVVVGGGGASVPARGGRRSARGRRRRRRGGRRRRGRRLRQSLSRCAVVVVGAVVVAGAVVCVVAVGTLGRLRRGRRRRARAAAACVSANASAGAAQQRRRRRARPAATTRRGASARRDAACGSAAGRDHHASRRSSSLSSREERRAVGAAARAGSCASDASTA